jgi:hemoglobin
MTADPGARDAPRGETLYEHAGGAEAIHRLEGAFYAKVLADPLLVELFGAGQPQHVDHLTAFTSESFGGPDRFTRELGFAHLIAVHRGLHITEEQRQRFVALYLEALDESDLPTDERFRTAVREHVEFGSQVAMQNSNAETDDELHPLREVPRWTW